MKLCDRDEFEMDLVLLYGNKVVLTRLAGKKWPSPYEPETRDGDTAS